MAIKSVQAIVNGVTTTLTYDSASKTYKATLTAPAKSSYNQSGHYYGVQIIAKDEAGNTTTVNQSDAEHYMRYMDDFVIISEDLEQLKRWEKQIEIFLADVLKLQLNPKTTIVYAKNGVDFVGYRHWNSTKKIRKDAMRRLKRLMKNFKDGTITEEFFDKSFTSRIGSIKHADTYNLVQKITCEAKELKESHA